MRNLAFSIMALAAGLQVSETRGLFQQNESGRLIVTEPLPDAFLTGPVALSAHVEPASLAVVRADFFVDGVLACRATVPPLVCQYDAGPMVRERQVRVAVLLADGRRFVETVTTKGLDFDATSGVNAILVPVVVSDWRGRFVPGLTQAEFAVTEDGTPQTIQFFKAEDIPLDLAFAIDISGSMAPILADVKAGLRAFLRTLKPIDRVTLLAFNERVFVLARSETDATRRDEAIGRMTAQGGTAIFDALVTGAEVLGNKISRRAIIAFTDGSDMHSLAPRASVEARLRSTDVSVYLVTYGRAAQAEAEKARLTALAEATGGRVYAVNKTAEIPETLTEIVDALSQHYLMGYTPTNPARDGTLRKISVTVPAKRGYELKYRGSYHAGPSK